MFKPDIAFIDPDVCGDGVLFKVIDMPMRFNGEIEVMG